MAVKKITKKKTLKASKPKGSQTITRKEISEAISEEVGLSRQMSTQILESVLEEMTQGLINGKQLKISSFASFNVNDKNERIGRNPKTGEEKPITARKAISFKASDGFKERVAKKK